MEASVDKDIPVAGSDRLYCSAHLRQLYAHRLFKPLWIADGTPNRLALDLVQCLRRVDEEGLRLQDYHLSSIGTHLSRIAIQSSDRTISQDQWADLDLLFSDAFLLLSSHGQNGRADRTLLGKEWNGERENLDLARILMTALKTNDVCGTLQSLFPRHQEYVGLKSALARYRVIMARGGWKSVPQGSDIGPDGYGERAQALQERLLGSEDLAEPFDPGISDQRLTKALKTFQSRHGIKTDGILNSATVKALNVPVEDRVRQLLINMERWRWLPRNLGYSRILVNIAAYDCTVLEGHKSVLNMKAVVGRPYRQSPVFSALMRYVVFNPSWEVPPNIAHQDIIPHAQKDPEYFAKNKIRVISGWGEESRDIDPTTVDWKQFNGKRPPFRFHQIPGTTNPLGRVKFMFPNPHSVYLHDTPTRKLFDRDVRTFSSGCIRLEKPLELAAHLFKNTPLSRSEALNSLLAKKSEQTIPLTTPIPVHILYLTAWCDQDGLIHFGSDIYDRDPAVINALSASPTPIPVIAPPPMPH